MGPEVEFIAGNEAIKINHDRLPVPKPAFTDREEDSGNAKTPYKEVRGDRPTWVDGAPISVVDGCKYEKEIVEEGYE